MPPGELASESTTIIDAFGAGVTDTPHFAVAAETIAARAVGSSIVGNSSGTGANVARSASSAFFVGNGSMMRRFPSL